MYKNIILAIKLYVFALILLIYNNNVCAITLARYLDEVIKNNDEYLSNQLLEKSGFTRSEEGFLMLSPNLGGDIRYDKDKQPRLSEVTSQKTRIETFNLGITKKFATGTNMRVGYDNENIWLEDRSELLVARHKAWFVRPTISLEQSLLRDWLGTETKALINLKNSQAKAQGHLSKFTNQKILADAESVYWDMASVLANIKIKQEAIERSKKLLDWAKRRQDLGLGNDSDYLQAKAALEEREFELQTITQAQKNTARLFNALITLSSDKSPEQLESFHNTDLNALRPKDPELPPGIREDLKLEHENYIVASSRAIVAKQDVYPDINFKIKYFPTGSNIHYNNSASQALKQQHDTINVGLSFNIPLDINLMHNVHDAYKSEERASELAYIRKNFEVANEWRKLTEQFNLLLTQLRTAHNITQIQLEKLRNEESLLKNGRTTTFQVIQFEQDYFYAKSQYLDIKNKLLKLSAMLKLFN